MTPAAWLLTGIRRATIALPMLALAALPAAAQNTTAPRPGVNRQAAAQDEFQQRLNGYLKLREDLSKKLKPLAPTADTAELTSRQESLAAAIRQSRRGAKRGDLIPEAAATLIRQTIVADFEKRQPSARHAALEEVPKGVVPVINKTYPAKEALPTVPPLLLNNLPRLPDNLQYRFFGRHVVILDGDTQLIIDYIANVLPAA